MINNLTEGKPLKLLFFFAVPMVVGNLFQQLYNMVDSMVVGRFVGEDALASPWDVPLSSPSSSGPGKSGK